LYYYFLKGEKHSKRSVFAAQKSNPYGEGGDSKRSEGALRNFEKRRKAP